MAEGPCDDCGEVVSDALVPTVSLSVDGEGIDSQRLCPGCFVDWIDRSQRKMQTEPTPVADGVDVDVVVD